MKVLVLPRAEKELKNLPKFDQIAVIEKIKKIPKEPNSEKLTGYSNIYRVRVGNYRMVYRKTVDIISIILIRHRKEVYKILKQIIG